MATITDVQIILDRIQIIINAERAEIQGMISAFRTQIEDLQNRPATKEDLDALGLELDGMITRIGKISEAKVTSFIWDDSAWDDIEKVWRGSR